MSAIRGFLLISLMGITAVASQENEVDLWRFQAGKLVPEELDKIESPGHSCYIILHRKQGIDVENWNVYYFIPEKPAQHKDEDYDTAALAVSIHYKLGLKTRIRREAEGHESSTFKELFSSFKYKESVAANKFAPWQTKKVFKITQEKKDKPLTMTERPVQLLEVLENSTFCLVCALDEVYVYCRDSANEKEKKSAGALVEILLNRRKQESNDAVMIAMPRESASKGELGFKEFVAKFQEASETMSQDDVDMLDIPYPFTLKEMRRILLQTEFTSDGLEYFNMEIYQLGDKYSNDEKKETRSYPYISNLSSHFSYMIDSKSNLGLLVWMGKLSRSASRERAAWQAELTMKYYKEDRGTPVIFIAEDDITPELVGTDNLRLTSLKQVVVTVLNKYVNQ